MNDNLNEHLSKIKQMFNYKLNETPNYRPLIDDDSEFDEFPDQDVFMTNDGSPSPSSPEYSQVFEQEEDENELDEPVSSGDDQEKEDDEEINIQSDNVEVSSKEDSELDEPVDDPMKKIEQNDSVDKIQNDIIKHNIKVMKDLHSKLEDLDMYVRGINTKLDDLGKKVEEVEEPTNTEKLVSKKEQSYPYYFNLNDYWKGNFFQEKNNNVNDDGIVKLSDGTYLADYDTIMNQINDSDVEMI